MKKLIFIVCLFYGYLNATNLLFNLFNLNPNIKSYINNTFNPFLNTESTLTFINTAVLFASFIKILSQKEDIPFIQKTIINLSTLSTVCAYILFYKKGSSLKPTIKSTIAALTLLIQAYLENEFSNAHAYTKKTPNA
jgi:hypothetical protein